MMPHLQMGMPIGLLKQKLTLNTVIKPAAEKAIYSAQKNYLAESLAHLDTGFSANPTKMAETLSENITKLPNSEQNTLFTNLMSMPKNQTLVNLLETIQGKINEVKGINKPSIDFSMKKLFVAAKNNGCDLSQLAKK